MRRRLAAEPSATDFVPASDYEASTPAAFGLPEVPVLYLQRQVQLNDYPAKIWVASDGLYMWSEQQGFVADLDNVFLTTEQLKVGETGFQLNATDSELWGEVSRALGRAYSFNEALGTQEDDVELAVPVDFESGQADDLGDARLEHSVGTGLSLSSGPAIASKRRRPS